MTNAYNEKMLLDLICDVISTSAGMKVVESDVGHLVRPVLDAQDPANRRQAASNFLAITAMYEDRHREDAYSNILDWRLNPPRGGFILAKRASWLTKEKNERLEKAIRAHDFDQAESILDLHPLPRLRVIVGRLADLRR
jgi:hypothetical protein